MSQSVQTGGSLALTQGLNPSVMNRFARKPEGQAVSKVAKDFESMFMSQMLQPMFDTVGVDKLFGGGHGEEMMRGFLVQEYGKMMASRGNFGIADAIQNAMVNTQQKASAYAQTNNNGATNVTGQVQ